MLPAVLSLALALGGGLMDARGLVAALSLAVACVVARHASGALALVAQLVMLLLGAALFVHAVPGFDNPRVLHDVVLGPDALPYSKYLNFDKGIAALCLLGLYAPACTTSDEGARHLAGIAWRFAVVVAIVMALTLVVGYVRWDPKLPSWWPLWLWSMLFLTALPEEAAFRGVVQTELAQALGHRRYAAMIAVVAAGMLFGAAHLAGGPTYVLLATVAGIGYGWVYASTRSLGAAIVTHAGLNTIHLLFFTYPALVDVSSR